MEYRLAACVGRLDRQVGDSVLLAFSYKGLEEMTCTRTLAQFLALRKAVKKIFNKALEK